MPHLTDITIYFLPEDKELFDEHWLDTESKPLGADGDPHILAGLQEGSVVAEPQELNDFVDRKFFGHYNSSPGAYVAARFFCGGKGDIFTHKCDDEGQLSLLSAIDNIKGPPLIIPDKTFQFVVSYRYLVRQMLDEAEAWLDEQTKKLEREALKRQADQLVGEDSDAEKPHKTENEDE